MKDFHSPLGTVNRILRHRESYFFFGGGGERVLSFLRAVIGMLKCCWFESNGTDLIRYSLLSMAGRMLRAKLTTRTSTA